MLKKFAFTTVLCGTLLTAGIASAAAGFTGPGSDNFPGKNQNQSWGQQLTPQQRQQAEKIFNENFASLDETRQALAAKRQALDAELSSENPDPAKIESLSREIGELRGKILAARVKVRSQLAEEGLPQDFYGPGGPKGSRDRNRGPEVWHHGKRRHGHGHYRGDDIPPCGYGCPGMMMGGWR